MPPSRSLPSTLYHARLHLSDQRRLLPCPGLQGQVRKAYPLLSQCHVQLVGSLGPDGRGAHPLAIPTLRAGDAALRKLRLLRFPGAISRAFHPASGGNHALFRQPAPGRLPAELSASLAGPELYELRFSARVSMYLSV